VIRPRKLRRHELAAHAELDASLTPTLAESYMQQAMAALQEHVQARLRALPAGWRVQVKLAGVDRSVSTTKVEWRLEPLAPGYGPPPGWAAYGPLVEACHTESRSRAG
jgi:hypothetical protein